MIIYSLSDGDRNWTLTVSLMGFKKSYNIEGLLMVLWFC